MPLICIGPVCIPVTALLPILAYIARPVWKRLPPSTQDALVRGYNSFQDWMQRHVWDRLGWKAKREAPPRAKRDAPMPPARTDGAPTEASSTTAPGSAPAADGASEGGTGEVTPASLRSQCGGVVPLTSDDAWDAAMQLSREGNLPIVVDFTATWCGPCQKIAPFFAQLAGKHGARALFVQVDSDELGDVAMSCGVTALPNFQVIRPVRVDGPIRPSLPAADTSADILRQSYPAAA